MQPLDVEKLYVHVYITNSCFVYYNNYYYYFTVFQSGGVDVSQPIVFSCGGAMVAPLVAFALYLTGLSVPVYDVSYNVHA